MRVLFTKKLTENQKENLPFSLDDYDFIEVKPLPFALPFPPSKHWIFTSKNAVEIVGKPQKISLTQSIYVVGRKTQETLSYFGNFERIKTPKNKENSNGLVQLIEEENSDDFLYLCGKKRLPNLEQYFAESKKKYKVVEVYDTLLTPALYLEMERYDWLCFCSPSAVESYLTTYKILPKHKILCIGKTTATALCKFENKIEISDVASVESMLHYMKEKMIKD